MTTRTILVVEDNASERELLREALGEALVGVVITFTTTVHDAVEWLAAQPDQALPDLVITDHHLPDQQGQALITALRGAVRSRGVPVVMLSGDIQRPPGIDGVAWYGKPDTWNGWSELARGLCAEYVMKPGADRG